MYFTLCVLLTQIPIPPLLDQPPPAQALDHTSYVTAHNLMEPLGTVREQTFTDHR